MAQWTANGTSSGGIPKWSSVRINAGSGKSNRSSNNTAMFQNSSAEVFQQNAHAPYEAVGVFAVSAAQHANTTGESAKADSAGWNLRQAYEGPLVSFSLGTDNSATMANGESVLVSGGSLNAYGIVTTNTTGHVVSIATGQPPSNPTYTNPTGRFLNNTGISFAFQREKHLLSITPVAAGSSGWTNGDLVFAGNGFITGIGVVTTSASGNLASVAVNAAANGGFGAGLWANNVANGVVTFTFQTANASAANGASGFTANLTTSSGGNVAGVIMGGRAGRVSYECLVGMGTLSAANNTILPS